MSSQTRPETTTRTAVLCGLDPGVTRLEEQAQTHGSLSVRRIADAELLLEGHFVQNYCGIVMTLDFAVRHLRPCNAGATSWGDVPLLVLLPGDSIDYQVSEKLLRCGASGFLENECGIDVLELALQRTGQGELWVTRGLLSSLIKQSLMGLGLHRLTPREHEILRCVVSGATNQEIAERLFVTRETVRWHLRTIYGKLGVHSRDAVVELIKSNELANRS